MKIRAIAMLGLALVLALSAVFIAQGWLMPSGPADGVPAITVVVAKAPIATGEALTKEKLAAAPWPSQAIPAGAFASIEEMLGKAGETRVALQRIESNEPILAARVSGLTTRTGLTAIIAPEMRATAIRVNDVNGVAGFIRAGDRVDILLTRDGGRANEGPTADILLQNIKVLAIDQDASDTREKPSVARAVTVEVSPLQSQQLVLAQQVGTLALALRGMTGVDSAAAKTVTLGDLRAGHRSEPSETTRPLAPIAFPAAEAHARPVAKVNVMRGTEATQLEVPSEPAPPKAKRERKPDVMSKQSNRLPPADSRRP
jgi:pilus assembly protein CpaB